MASDCNCCGEDYTRIESKLKLHAPTLLASNAKDVLLNSHDVNSIAECHEYSALLSAILSETIKDKAIMLSLVKTRNNFLTSSLSSSSSSCSSCHPPNTQVVFQLL